MIDSQNLITLITVSGGLGIFLLGLIIMTNSLHSLTGDKLRSIMLSLTKSPYSGAFSGTIMTAILQSSSATTVTAVGLVSAGILSFTEALGIIFGANLGTTITGWIVAIFGFKLKLSLILMPLILIGTILKLFAKKTLATIGFTIAGFGLIFVGISIMQESMQNIQGIINPDNLPNDTFIGRLQLIAIGMLFTVITQSSSAGVATTLTILYAGAINFQQAAALVIGMDIGTTITAVLATIGGNVNTKRTGYSHMVYNFITAILAFMLITPFINFWEYIFNSSIVNNAEIGLVAFHTLFNFLGVILILPFSAQFAQFIKFLIHENKNLYTSNLDDILIKEPSLALNVLIRSIKKEFIDLLDYTYFIITNKENSNNINLENLQLALDETQSYADKIHLLKSTEKQWEYLVSIIHITDHLQRLHERCEEDENRAIKAKESKELNDIVQSLSINIKETIKLIENKNFEKAANINAKFTNNFEKRLHEYRGKITDSIALGEIDIQEGSAKLEAIRWLLRVSVHISRISHHLEKAINCI